MPTLLDLFRVNHDAVNQTPERLRNLPPAPKTPEWDVRSGEPEPGLGQVTPEEWLPPGLGMKLSALLGKGAMLAGSIKAAKSMKGLPRSAEETANAFATAQRNASLPVEQGGLGLHPNNTAEERAAAMGFNGEGYHSTISPYELERLDAARRPSSLGSQYDDLAVNHESLLGTHVGTPQAADDRWGGLGASRGAVYPVKFRNTNPWLDDSGNMLEEGRPLQGSMYGRMGELDMGNYEPKDFIKNRDAIFKDNTHIPYENWHEDEGSISHIVPPKNLRSRFAAFDPAKRNSDDLLGYANPYLLGLISAGTLGATKLFGFGNDNR